MAAAWSSASFPFRQPPTRTPSAPVKEPSAGVIPEAEPRSDGADRYLARATREYEKGHIIQPLWVRAVAQADGDETLARAAYLRARATAMRLTEREKRTDMAARIALAPQGAEPPEAPPQSSDVAASDKAGRSAADPKRKYLAAMAVAVGSIAVGAWWLLAPGESVSTAPAGVAAAPSSTRSARASLPGSKQAAGATANQEDPNEYFGAKVQELKHAGNWNVLVLYAAEWTRKRPESGAAWKELSIGYANMRQFDDAYNAARKAVQVAPGDSGSWRNLGQVNLALEQPAAALDAFERAAALNDQDMQSLVQVGILNTQLGHLPEAKDAFDRVLAANAENVDALCGEASIAQRQGRQKDADALMRQLKSVDGKCRDWSEVGGAPAARSVATSAAKTQAPAPAGAARRLAR